MWRVSPPRNGLTGAGFAKSVCKNLHGKELRDQNIDNKALESHPDVSGRTAFAWAMILFFACGRQGWMSHGTHWDMSFEQLRSRLQRNLQAPALERRY